MSLVIHYWIGRCTRLPGRIRLRNDLYCVGRGIKLYSLTHIWLIPASWPNSTVVYNVYTLQTKLLLTGWHHMAHTEAYETLHYITLYLIYLNCAEKERQHGIWHHRWRLPTWRVLRRCRNSPQIHVALRPSSDRKGSPLPCPTRPTMTLQPWPHAERTTSLSTIWVAGWLSGYDSTSLFAQLGYIHCDQKTPRPPL